MRKIYGGLEGSDVLINLRTGDALRGRVGEIGQEHLDLKSGTVLINRSGEHPLKGPTVIVPETSIDWVQVIGR